MANKVRKRKARNSKMPASIGWFDVPADDLGRAKVREVSSSGKRVLAHRYRWPGLVARQRSAAAYASWSYDHDLCHRPKPGQGRSESAEPLRNCL